MNGVAESVGVRGLIGVCVGLQTGESSAGIGRVFAAEE